MNRRTFVTGTLGLAAAIAAPETVASRTTQRQTLLQDYAGCWNIVLTDDRL